MWIFRKEEKEVQYNCTQDSQKCKSFLAAVQHPQPLPASSNAPTFHLFFLLRPALISLYTLSLAPSLAQNPISSEGEAAAGSAQQARWPWGSYSRKTPGFGPALHQEQPTPELCHHHCPNPAPSGTAQVVLSCSQGVWDGVQEMQEMQVCSPALPVQFLLLASRAASSAQHGCKAIFLTNDFVGQRNLRLLLFSYPTVTGYFVVLWTITRINMDRFRAWVLWK